MKICTNIASFRVWIVHRFTVNVEKQGIEFKFVVMLNKVRFVNSINAVPA